ncbi:MAG: tripartite tricarboxylate transporter substrate binding protein [Casimicrobiaceae bacterium]
MITGAFCLRRGFVACLLLLLTGGALAQAWPSKPIRFIVPYPPGGGTDIVARLIAPRMAEALGQPVIVDNRPGASTIIGTDAVAKAAPDGYTFGLITDSHAINPNFQATLPYDSVKDFAPISQVVFVPFVLIANPALQIKSVHDLIAAAKANPGKLNYASAGNGSPHYLAMEWFKSQAGVNLNHIPYKGVAAGVADVMAGHVDVMFTGMSSGLPPMKAGKLTGLAVSSPQRQPSAPEIPTVAESGVPGFDFVTWYGLVAPAGTPKEIVARLSREVGRALAVPEVRAQLVTLGVEAAPSTPEEFAAFLHKQAGTWTQIIKVTGAKGE